MIIIYNISFASKIIFDLKINVYVLFIFSTFWACALMIGLQ